MDVKYFFLYRDRPFSTLRGRFREEFCYWGMVAEEFNDRLGGLKGRIEKGVYSNDPDFLETLYVSYRKCEIWM